MEWDGVTVRADYKAVVVAGRDFLADAARDGDWPDVFRVLDNERRWVNAGRVGGKSGYAPLHQAAWQGAPEDVVRELLARGAWRTLRSTDGERPVDIAERRGHDHLIEPLGPLMLRRVPDAEAHLHDLIRSRIPHLVTQSALRLPQLGPLSEVDEPRMWFPVPGMYGGFDILLNGDSLNVDSWNRVVGGWAQTHRITADGWELVADGWDG